MDAGTHIKTRMVDIGGGIANKAIKCRDLVKIKVLDTYSKVRSAAEQIPVPVKVKKAFFYIQEKGYTFYVFVKDGTMHMYSNFADAILRIKIKGVETLESAKSMAVATIARVTTV